MKLPRDLSGAELSKALAKNQRGGHIRLTTQRNGEHHITVPNHDAIKAGTLAGILKDVCEHVGMQRDELLNVLRS